MLKLRIITIMNEPRMENCTIGWLQDRYCAVDAQDIIPYGREGRRENAGIITMISGMACNYDLMYLIYEIP